MKNYLFLNRNKKENDRRKGRGSMAKQILWDALPETEFEFEELLFAARDEERDIEQVRIRGIVVSGLDMSGLGFYQVSFENCRFLGCCLEKTAFRAVRFQNCDLSNSDVSWSYWSDCLWEEVKAVGIKAQKASFLRTKMKHSNLRYGNLGESKLEKWQAERCDFTESFLTACQCKELVLRENRFVRTSFFQTPLRGIDFTSCELEEVFVSEDGTELAGAIVDVYQAAEFAKLLGLKVVG